MINGYDIAYGLGLGVCFPFLFARHRTRHKLLLALGLRMGYLPARPGNAMAVVIHAVSLGEMNATRELVKQLQEKDPQLHLVITTTTVTGYDRGRQLYGGQSNITLTRFPLDFSSAINRLLDAVRPSLIVLMEGEIWPNFLRQCERRKIPVVLINGRMSESAFKRYRWTKFFTASMLRRIRQLCVQDKLYADRFMALGVLKDRIQITGTMKFDTAHIADSVGGDDQLAIEVGLSRKEEPIWVCGSTGPGEEILLLECYGECLKKFPNLRLVIVPRKPERFDEVASVIESKGFALVRRSVPPTPDSEVLRRAGSIVNRSSVILGDTMGELRKFYSLATVVFVGRSLIDLGSRQWGSDMIEPAALAKPVVVGPWTHNFAEAVRSFKAADAIVEVKEVSELISTISGWLEATSTANQIGRRAQDVVRLNQGATAQHAQVILNSIGVSPMELSAHGRDAHATRPD